MTVVTEGVETEEQVSALIACGVEEGQGLSRRRTPAFGEVH